MNFLSYKFKALKQAISKYDYLYFTVSEVNYYGSKAEVVLCDAITGKIATKIVVDTTADIEAAQALKIAVDEKALVVYDCKAYTAIMVHIRAHDTNIDRYHPLIASVFSIADISATLKIKYFSSITAEVDIIIEAQAQGACFDQTDVKLMAAQALAVIIRGIDTDSSEAFVESIAPVSLEILTENGDEAGITVNLLESTLFSVVSENIVTGSAMFALSRILTLEDHYNKNLQWLETKTLKEMSIIQIQ